MHVTSSHRSFRVFLIAFTVIAVWPVMTTMAAGPGASEEAFPDYTPAHTVIKCPYLPPDLSEIPTCHDKKATCVGTAGHDLILGSDKKDVIVAGPGNDTVHGDADDDIICGGPGNDSLFGARGVDIIYGGPGDDWLFGAPDPDQLYGGAGDFDVLWEGPGFGKVDGGAGAYDVCMLQREMAEVVEGTCETIYPPPGYVHDDEPEPGMLKRSDPLKLKK
jgi:hypothetical protein